MDSALAEWLATHRHLITTADLRHLGVLASAAHRLVASGQLVRVRKNVLVEAAYWDPLQPSQRHKVRAEAALISKESGKGVLSHQSSLALADVPLFGVSSRTHMLLVEGARSRSTRRDAFHVSIGKQQLIECGEQWRVRDALACLQVADVYGVEAGLVSADAVIARGASKNQFSEALAAGRFERGLTRPRQVADLVDGRMESPGESRCRWLLHCLGMGAFEPQVAFRLPNGRTVRVDFFCREGGTVVEFDGLIKYAGSPDLVGEKLREDGLRALGLQVVRLTWADLARPTQVKNALRAAF